MRNFSLLINPAPALFYIHCLPQTNHSLLICPKIQFNIFTTLLSISQSFSHTCSNSSEFTICQSHFLYLLSGHAYTVHPPSPSSIYLLSHLFSPQNSGCQNTFSIKNQVVNIFTFAGHTGSVPATQHHHCSQKQSQTVHKWMGMALSNEAIQGH